MNLNVFSSKSNFRILWETIKVHYLGNDVYKVKVNACIDDKIATLSFHIKDAILQSEKEEIGFPSYLTISEHLQLMLPFVNINNKLFEIKIEEDKDEGR